MINKNPKAIILVGVPGVGKTTLRLKEYSNWSHLSTDDFIDIHAKSVGKTYSDVWSEYCNIAAIKFESKFREITSNRENVIVDKTFMTRKSRARVVNRLKQSGYSVKVIVLKEEFEVVKERLQIRGEKTGKLIPLQVVLTMLSHYQEPTSDELWDTLIVIESGKIVKNISKVES